jgi:hypothetical protein
VGQISRQNKAILGTNFSIRYDQKLASQGRLGIETDRKPFARVAFLDKSGSTSVSKTRSRWPVISG